MNKTSTAHNIQWKSNTIQDAVNLAEEECLSTTFGCDNIIEYDFFDGSVLIIRAEDVSAYASR